ncbi:MAG: transglutaminase domain-containing protein, partial [Luteibaculum sp.]
MKHFLLLCPLLFVTFSISSKEPEKLPKKVTESVSELTAHLTEGLGSEREKVRALYHWITNNIAYDYDKLQKGKVTFFKGPEQVLKDEKAICTGYVYLLGAMLDEIGIEWEDIQGYSNSPAPYFIPTIVLDDHAWIAIKIDGEWQLADPTWDAGYVGALYKEEKIDSYEKQLEKIKKLKRKNSKLRQKGKPERIIPEIDTIPEKNYNGKVGFVKDP